MIYNCGEYTIGGDDPSRDTNFRRSSIEYPDYFHPKN